MKNIVQLIILFVFIFNLGLADAQTTIVFYDDFITSDNKWYTGSDEQWEFKIHNGKYVLNGKNINGGGNIVTNEIILDENKDFEIEAIIHKVSGVNDRGYGIVWGYSDNANFNQFSISGTGYFSISSFTDGFKRSYYPWTPSDYINKDNMSTDTLKIKRIGGMLYYFVNDGYIAKTKNLKFHNNYIGFNIYNNQKIEVDRLIVRAGESEINKDEKICEAVRYIVEKMDSNFTGLYSGEAFGSGMKVYQLDYMFPGASKESNIGNEGKTWQLSYELADKTDYATAMAIYEKLIYNLHQCVPKGWKESSGRLNKYMIRHSFKLKSTTDLHLYPDGKEPIISVLIFGVNDVNTVSLIFRTEKI